jgi:hypothetical protein
MGLAIEGCKAIATYIREVNNFLLIFHYSWLLFILFAVYIERHVIDTLNFWVVDYRSETGAIGEYKEAWVSAWLTLGGGSHLPSLFYTWSLDWSG